MVYGTLVIAYLFLGGAAGGTFLVMAAWSLTLHRALPHRSAPARREFRILRGRAYAVATAALAAAMLCLLWDLDYPERALTIFTAARPTVLTFGACVLAALLGVGLLLTLVNLFHLRFFSGRVKRVLDCLCALLAIAVMGYTGVFLYSNVGIAFWHTFFLVGLFFCSALSSGLSAVLLVDYFAQSETKLLHAVRPLQKAHLACLAVELVFMVAFTGATWANPYAASSLSALLSEAVLPTALVGAAGLGIVVPFALESYALLRKEQRAIPVSDFVCLIGAFCLRWTVIVCGVH
ncbi:NrfD/PsrC family molybdoenzyme membrane anchor subunit [Adlercreutzia sp. R25]|uniref:NrfD/PsrC family molybdoenzyme membrane anchor subunit n=1 Tax=Adlercreutzia shanghongiae TaxID=3111773 RepID=A0ABU6IYT3_9ACTN|nr:MULTISPECIES: NrfD/PsrC family molybdoenzyme membrane anchor subunit [unclassified Adlercreutzia]MEC4271819.1 NrfD/PsrC family molybdoenzyme membrane anchor subunit [Adlercreutzia sp. R25]MEC4294826.1 NrfD/PsrC family molybdoenzyme membrane anchor subunit [Adlercreutzia sp. R22]